MRYLFVILFLILFLILFFNKNFFYTYLFFILKYNTEYDLNYKNINYNYNPKYKGYRLGDMIKYENWRNTKKGKKYHNNNFPDSIAVKYMKTTNITDDLDTLEYIIDKYRINELTPSINDLVIHLRTGDAIEKTITSIKMLRDKINDKYTKNIKYFKNKLKNKNKNINNIILVSGTHYPYPNFDKSKKYISIIKKYFESEGYNVKLRLNHPPDDDFVFMSRSKNFISSGGGYSDLISKMVKRKGNKVL